MNVSRYFLLLLGVPLRSGGGLTHLRGRGREESKEGRSTELRAADSISMALLME